MNENNLKDTTTMPSLILQDRLVTDGNDGRLQLDDDSTCYFAGFPNRQSIESAAIQVLMMVVKTGRKVSAVARSSSNQLLVLGDCVQDDLDTHIKSFTATKYTKDN